MEYGDYQYYYNNAQNRYYDACGNITTCNNRISELNKTKQKTVSEINHLKVEIRNHEHALEQIEQIRKQDDRLNQKLQAISTKTGEAAVNFTMMVNASDVTSKNLTEVFGEETARTKSTLTTILNTLNAKKNQLVAKIGELKGEKKAAENKLVSLDGQIKTTKSDIGEWMRIKTNAAIDMEYYRRKMQESA